MTTAAQPTAPVRGHRPAQARIDLGRLADNYRAIADYAGLVRRLPLTVISAT